MRPLVTSAPPASPMRRSFYNLVVSDQFEVAIMVVILLNMVQMGTDWWEPYDNAPYIPHLKLAQACINIAFFVVYVLEMVVKWLGLGVGNYFRDRWCIFGFVIVVFSFVDIFTFLTDGNGIGFPPSIIRMLRLVRVIRILRIIKSAKSMRAIVMTVFVSLPQLSNIMILINLVVLVFSLICVDLFFGVNYTAGNFDLAANKSNTRALGEVYVADGYYFSDDGTNWGEGINRHANFEFIWTALSRSTACRRASRSTASCTTRTRRSGGATGCAAARRGPSSTASFRRSRSPAAAW